MSKSRMEAFSDGVIAILITIMVLELGVPSGHEFRDLHELRPVLLSYVLSFVYMAIYWNNHHHLMQIVKFVDGRILWANMHLLFWLSLIPFATAWMGESSFAQDPVIAYAVLMFMCGLAFTILTMALVARHGRDSSLARALGRDYKGKLSLVAYAIAFVLARFANMPRIACLFFVAVGLMWLVPDRRIEGLLSQETD